MKKTIAELINSQREISAKLVNANEEDAVKLQREYEANKREIDTLNQEAIAAKNAPAQKRESLVMKLREAMKDNKRSVTVQGYTPEGGSAVSGVHNDAVDIEMQGLLEPLYAKSVLSELGVRFFPGLPQGDIQIPILGKGSVGWAGEISAASASNNTMTHKTLKPKRLTAYVDISKQLIMQDTVGAEAAIRRDLVNAINNELEATIFGDNAGDTTKPAGIFYNQNLSAKTTYADICNLEATVEDSNVFGNLKYLLSPKAKADLRSMVKGSGSNRGLVFEGGSVDGVPAVVTGNVNPAVAAVGTQGETGYVAAHGAAGSLVYGDFSNLAVGSWGDIEITIDEYTQAVNGCIRLVVNAYFDAAVLRSEAFAFAKTRS